MKTKRQKEDLQAVYDTQEARLKAIKEGEDPFMVRCKLCLNHTDENSLLSCEACMPQLPDWEYMCGKAARHHIIQGTPPEEVVGWLKELIRSEQEESNETKDD